MGMNPHQNSSDSLFDVKLIGGVGSLFLGVGLVILFSFFSISEFNNWLQFFRELEAGEAVVLGSWVENEDDLPPTSGVRYAYVYNEQEYVEEFYYEGHPFKTDSTITIEIVKGKPGFSRVQGVTSHFESLLIFVIMLLLFILIGFGLEGFAIYLLFLYLKNKTNPQPKSSHRRRSRLP